MLINTSVFIRSDKKSVYNLLKNIEQFPNFIRDVNSIVVVKKTQNMLTLKWDINVDGANIVWVEEDVFYNQDMKVRFRMVDGDYDKYEGEWLVEDSPRGVRLILSVDIDWGVSALVKFVKSVVMKKTKRSFKTLLMAIKKEIERKR